MSSSSSSTSFPVGSSVILQNLIKGASLNGKKGIVKSQLNKTSRRQEVYVFEAQKSMSIKPNNLQYEPRDLSSLSVREMKSILSYSSSSTNDDESDWAGLDKDELRTKVKDVIGSDDAEDGIEIASWVAKANEPKNIPASSSMATGNNAGNSTFNSSQLRQGEYNIVYSLSLIVIDKILNFIIHVICCPLFFCLYRGGKDVVNVT